MTTNDQAKPRALEEAKQIINDYAQKCATVDQGNLYFAATQFEAAFTMLQAEFAKMKEAYGVVRKALKDAQSIERDRIFEDIRCPGFDGSMKIETRYDEALAKAEEVLK